ncbi:FumA C-terminus/TtdB family hydratase beta subunit, partial [Candidatus Pyrohabitans sp.]
MRHELRTPVGREEVLGLRAGDVVYLSGAIVTARDRAHRRALEMRKEDVPASFNVVYHCGPLVRKRGEEWEVLSAGPTTSARMEPYLAQLLEKFSTRLIIGKGGFSTGVEKLFKQHTCAYLAFTGGAGALAARAVKRVLAVHWLELGIP